MALLTRRRWLEEGLALLEEAGAEALTIESLTSRLGVTKGPFTTTSPITRTLRSGCWSCGKKKARFASSNGQNRRLHHQKSWHG